MELSEGAIARFRYPYYDPDGSPKRFDGYYSKTHLYFKAPPSFYGQELLIWHSVNVEENRDITWTLLNGQGRVHNAPDEEYDSPNADFDAIDNDENSGFYANPSQYDWTFIEKKTYIPYHCNKIRFSSPKEMFQPNFVSPDMVRWEKHRVWVVEANLHPGIRNVLSRRRFYLDEDCWLTALGECYDSAGNMARVTQQFLHVMPAMPGVLPVGFSLLNPQTGDYLFAGNMKTPPYTQPEIINQVIPESFFDAQLMSAEASF